MNIIFHGVLPLSEYFSVYLPCHLFARLTNMVHLAKTRDYYLIQISISKKNYVYLYIIITNTYLFYTINRFFSLTNFTCI